MTPRQKKRTSIFPAYSPPEEPDLTFEAWAVHLGGYIRVIAMRLAQIATLLVALGGGTAYVASTKPQPPPASNDSAAFARIKALEDSVRVHSKEIGDVGRDVRSVLYISCETLAKVQPAQSIPPQECRR